MLRQYSTRALIELRQIGKTPSGTDPVLHHAPEAFNGVEVVPTMRRQEMQPKLLVPVGQRRRELMRPMDATAVGHHDHLFAGMAKDGHHLYGCIGATPPYQNGGQPDRRLSRCH